MRTGAGVLLVALAVQAFARVHTVLLTPTTPSPAWLPARAGVSVNFTLHAGRAAARVLQSSAHAPCAPVEQGFARALDARTPSFVWQRPSTPTPEQSSEVWFYIDGECQNADGQKDKRQRLARRKDLDWAQLWGIVLGIAFGLVALAGIACCSWCCCFQHRVRAHQARLHVRDEGVQTGAAAHELPLYERRVRAGEVQLEEAPAPDYHLALRAPVEVSVGVMGPPARGSVEVGRAPTEVPLPPSPTDARHPPPPSPWSRDPPMPYLPPPSNTPYAPPQSPPRATSPAPRAVNPPAPPPPPDDLPPAYSHAPP